jgi:hypothetical protein
MGFFERPFLRLKISVTVLGTFLGAFPILAYALETTRENAYTGVGHMDLVPTILLCTIGALGSGLLIYWLMRRVESQNLSRHTFLLWLGIGTIFTLAVGPVTGIIMPFGLVIVAGLMGDIGLTQIPSGLLEAIFRVPRHAIEYSVLALFANGSIGLALAIGTFVIERINTLGKGAIAKYGAYSAATILALCVVLFLSLSDAETIARLV